MNKVFDRITFDPQIMGGAGVYSWNADTGLGHCWPNRSSGFL
jgi:hypothetical protein